MVGGMAGATVGRIVSLSTRQTPIIHGNTPACEGIIVYLGVWRVARLTSPPTVPPTIPPTVPLAIPPTVRPTIFPAISPPILPSSPENPATHQLAN